MSTKPLPGLGGAPYHTLGDAPVEAQYAEMMTRTARLIDTMFNGDAKPKKTGFVLLVFPFGPDEIGNADELGRCNYMSNARREDVIALLKDQLALFEGRAVDVSKVKQ